MNKKQQRNLAIAIVLLVVGYVFYMMYKKNRVIQEQNTNEALETNAFNQLDLSNNVVSESVQQTTTR